MSILALLVWAFGSLLLPDRLDSASVLVSLRYRGSSESSNGISWSMLGEGSLDVAMWVCRAVSMTLSRGSILSKSSSLESRPPFSARSL